MKYGWQFDLSDWQKIPDDLRDSAAWVGVDYTLIESGRVPEHPGVYLFCARPVGVKEISNSDAKLFGKLLTPIYVGQTTNLRKRFRQHCRNPSIRLRAASDCYRHFLRFWFLKRSAQSILEEEAALIQCFGPTANERYGVIRAKIDSPTRIGL